MPRRIRVAKCYYRDGTIWEYTHFNNIVSHLLDKSKIPHREDGPAIEYNNGDKEWWIDGKRHREGAPAIERKDGVKEWWINGKLHRVDGPAIFLAPINFERWYIDGCEISESLVKQIKEFAKEEDLVEYLLEDNKAVRFFAEKRLKELESRI